MILIQVPGPPVPAVRVEQGDTLIQICRTLCGDESRWKEMLPLNPGLETHPDLIHPGDIYKVPREWAADELREH